MAIITEFQGEYRFLSNFAPVLVSYQGIAYPSVENAYQAAKISQPLERVVFESCTASEAKQMGKKTILRDNWEAIKLLVMYELLSQKFRQSPYRNKLLFTVGDTLIEGNTWGDTFWGVCNGVGLNHLGRMIMKIRDEIQHES